MDHTLILIILFVPLVSFALTIVLVLSLRWFSHKERMASIARGLPLKERSAEQSLKEKNQLLLAIGLINALVGLALTLGLATLGLGPWLLAGLIPFFVGLALILTSLVVRPEKPKPKPVVKDEPPQAQNEESWTAAVEEEEQSKEEEENYIF